jgi:hypothetical protein
MKLMFFLVLLSMNLYYVYQQVLSSSISTVCAANQVEYFLPSNPTVPVCGECLPGVAGVNDPLRLCGINEYCTENGTCLAVKSNPFYGSPCPYDTTTSNSVSIQTCGGSGSGLTCFQHECLPCLDGMKDYSDGKICLENQWIYPYSSPFSPAVMLYLQPSATVLLFLVIIISIFVPIFLCLECGKCLKRRIQGLKLENKPFWKKVIAPLLRQGKAIQNHDVEMIGIAEVHSSDEE